MSKTLADFQIEVEASTANPLPVNDIGEKMLSDEKRTDLIKKQAQLQYESQEKKVEQDAKKLEMDSNYESLKSAMKLSDQEMVWLKEWIQS